MIIGLVKHNTAAYAVVSVVSAIETAVAELTKDTDEVRRHIIGADKIFSSLHDLHTRLGEELVLIDQAIAYNSKWRHDVAGAFMHETSGRVQELDMYVSRLEKRVEVIEKRVEAIQAALHKFKT